MKMIRWFQLALTALLALSLVNCGSGDDFQELLSKPMAYVGTEKCKVCHLEHYDSWRATLHSRAIQDVSENLDAIVTDLDPDKIRADLKKQEKDLKVPADEIYIPNVKDIKYTIGIQWKQGYLVEKNGTLYVAPVEYNVVTDRWSSYHEDNWDKRPWDKYCGGCHAMNVDLKKKTFSEARVGCEACHGPGSWHAALPKTAVFEKRQTIINPALIPTGLRTQICGSCHGSGESKKVEGAKWPVDYQPGRALGPYYKFPSYAEGNVKDYYANDLTKGHHQQYNDWKQSIKAKEGVSCTSCHYVHQLGVAPNQYQRRESGSGQCLACHMLINKNMSHSIHSFSNCIGCHMPRIVKSAESGDTRSHVFLTLLPEDTMKNPSIPNSCQTCHKHKETDLKTLQELYDGVAKRTLVRIHQTR